MIRLGLRWNKSKTADAGDSNGEEPKTTGGFEAALRAASAARDAARARQGLPAAEEQHAAISDTALPAKEQAAAESVTSPTAAPVPAHNAVVKDDAQPTVIQAEGEPVALQNSAQPMPVENEAQPAPTIAADSAAPIQTPEAVPTPAAPAHVDPAILANQLQAALGSRFLVLKPIAVGGMATIFLLRHRLHNGLFVAKVLHPELVPKPGIVAGFRTEATHAAQLGNHPNAIPVFDFGEGEDLFYLLMPYVEGADLDRVLLKAGPLSREETLQIAAQISSLLCHAEALGIVHADLTPGNIRLDIYGQYRLLDLGLSQARGPQDRPYTAGTPLYNSPEQLRGEPLDVRSDLYSLGAVLCECLTNRPAFHADTLEAIHARHHAGDWQLPDTLAEADPLRRLLQTLLSKDPAGRPESAYELSGILHALGWARPEFRPTPPGLDPFMKAPGAAPRKRLSS